MERHPTQGRKIRGRAPNREEQKLPETTKRRVKRAVRGTYQSLRQAPPEGVEVLPRE